MHSDGAASAMDAKQIKDGQDVGNVGVFERRVEDRDLTFTKGEGGFIDSETGSTWNIHGEAITGALKGTRLKPVVHFNHYWFAWHAFFPKTELRRE
jgi:hypothetical protein